MLSKETVDGLSPLKTAITAELIYNKRSTKFISTRFDMSDEEFAQVLKSHTKNKTVQLLIQQFEEQHHKDIKHVQKTIGKAVDLSKKYNIKDVVETPDQMRPRSIQCPFDLRETVYVIASNKIYSAYVHKIVVTENWSKVFVFLNNRDNGVSEQQCYEPDNIFTTKEQAINRVIGQEDLEDVERSCVIIETRRIGCICNIGDTIYRMINGKVVEDTVIKVSWSHILNYSNIDTAIKKGIELNDFFLSKDELIKHITNRIQD